MLREKQATVFDAVQQTGLSGTGRLHDLFVKIEGMTPGEFRNGGESLAIQYSFAQSLFGNILIASTTKGICYLAFVNDEQKALFALQQHFPKAHISQNRDNIQQNALNVFTCDWNKLNQIKLHLKASCFQLKVWGALLEIPEGQLTSYGDIARRIQSPSSCRAVGTAIGSNPVAFLIPCHRVIQSDGSMGGYMWGATRKTAIIGWEAANIHSSQ